MDGPLIIGGDFNTIIRVDERTGGSGRLSTNSLAFGEWCNNLSLIDMDFRGNKFTWRRGKEESTFVAKRLDRLSSLTCRFSRQIMLPFIFSCARKAKETQRKDHLDLKLPG